MDKSEERAAEPKKTEERLVELETKYNSFQADSILKKLGGLEELAKAPSRRALFVAVLTAVVPALTAFGGAFVSIQQTKATLQLEAAKNRTAVDVQIKQLETQLTGIGRTIDANAKQNDVVETNKIFQRVLASDVPESFRVATLIGLCDQNKNSSETLRTMAVTTLNAFDVSCGAQCDATENNKKKRQVCADQCAAIRCALGRPEPPGSEDNINGDCCRKALASVCTDHPLDKTKANEKGCE